MSDTMQKAWDLEKYLVPASEWTPEFLAHFPKDIQEEAEGPYPSGLGHCEEVEYFCLGTGQGPYIIWTEK